MMDDRKFSKKQFVAGIFVLSCGILMVVLQIFDWGMNGEKLEVGAAMGLLILGSVLMAVSHRKVDK